MIGLDTNVLLRWLIDESVWPDDAPDQTALAVATLNDARSRFFINAIVLAETMWVLANKLKLARASLIEVVQRLLYASNVVLAERRAVEAALRAFETGTAGFNDHLIGQINLACGCETTLTFDKGASRADPFTHLTRTS